MPRSGEYIHGLNHEGMLTYLPKFEGKTTMVCSTVSIQKVADILTALALGPV